MTRWPALHSIVWDIEENAAIVVRPDRFERPAFWFVARRSIQLSYGRTTQRPFYRTRSDLPKSTAGRVRAGGKAKTREGKLAIVWSAESRDQKGVSRTRSWYSAAIESAATRDTGEYPSEFAERVRREATRRRLTEAKRIVVVADGAAYNWNVAYETCPGMAQSRSWIAATPNNNSTTSPTPSMVKTVQWRNNGPASGKTNWTSYAWTIFSPLLVNTPIPARKPRRALAM